MGVHQTGKVDNDRRNLGMAVYYTETGREKQKDTKYGVY